MTRLTNYYGRTGSGKSSQMKRNVFHLVGRHLLVVPRRQSIEECYADLLELRAKERLAIPIIPFLRDDTKHYPTKIAQDITVRAASFAADAHCCLIVTQAAFLKLQPEEFSGWHLKLDEIPANGNLSGTLHAPIMWPGLANLFSIEPLSPADIERGIDAGFSRLKTKAGVEAKDVFADVRLSKEDENLFQRTASPIPVYTEARDWHDVGQRRCSWCSPWTLDFVDSFASVEIAACDIEESLMHLISPQTYEKVACQTSSSQASIRISYFDAGPSTCSSAYWQEAQGRRNLILIAKEIARHGEIDYWTCNESAESVLKPLMPKASAARLDPLDAADGTWVTQQQEGSNRFRSCTSCAILISAKAQDHEAVFERLNAGATKAAISKGREDGLIFQFASRGAIRNADYCGPYKIYVYDRQQAQALQTKLIAYDFPDTNIAHIALPGFEDRVRAPQGRKPTYASPDARAAAKRQHNAERQRRHRQKKRVRVNQPPAACRLQFNFDSRHRGPLPSDIG